MDIFRHEQSSNNVVRVLNLVDEGGGAEGEKSRDEERQARWARKCMSLGVFHIARRTYVMC